MGSFEKPNVYCLTATCGRHKLLERSLTCFLAQDYKGDHKLLIFNNSNVPQELGNLNLPANKQVILINQHLYSETGRPYENLGEIYSDTLKLIPEDVHIVVHTDDDDLYLPNHISEGVKGFLKAFCSQNDSGDYPYKAYKPQYSWYRHNLGTEIMSNNLEPSIFIDANYLKSKGYRLTTTDQHYGWYLPLLEEGRLFVDKEGVPTLIYNWGDTTPTFKTSGNAGDPNNFTNYRNFSRDHGDGVITPLPLEALEVYYREVEREKSVKIAKNADIIP